MSWEQDNYKQYITAQITQILPLTSISSREKNEKEKKNFDFSQLFPVK